MDRKNILVFPCGSEIGLEINRSLSDMEDLALYGGSSVDDHGKFVYDNYIPNVPFVDSKDFIYSINKLIKEFKIDFIFPAHDSVLLKLAQNSHSLDCELITSPLITCEISRSKKNTYKQLQDIIKTPKLYEQNDNFELPVFIKPNVGQGSKGSFKANTKLEIDLALTKNKDLLILEYLPGKEYTIDCFTDKNGELLFAQPRERIRTMFGISVNSRPVNKKELLVIANILNKQLVFRGVWFFQIKENNFGEPCLLEFAPRVAGTMAVCRIQGVNLPLLSVLDRLEVELFIPRKLFNVEIDRALSEKYEIDINYDTVYIFFEQTFIINNHLNTKLITFIYNMLEKNYKIFLFTENLLRTKYELEKKKIEIKIFNDIINSKDIIIFQKTNNYNAILISNIYQDYFLFERELNIPIFNTVALSV